MSQKRTHIDVPQRLDAVAKAPELPRIPDADDADAVRRAQELARRADVEWMNHRPRRRGRRA